MIIESELGGERNRNKDCIVFLIKRGETANSLIKMRKVDKYGIYPSPLGFSSNFDVSRLCRSTQMELCEII